MLRSAGVVVVATLALSLGGSSALAGGGAAAKPGDVAATRAYLTAHYRLEHTSKDSRQSVDAVLHGLVNHVKESCPNLLAGAPENTVTQDLRGELVADVGTALAHLDRQPTFVFAKRVKNLHWSDRKLTYYVHGFAAEQKATAELVAPDICVDAKVALTGGFQTVPPLSHRFEKEFDAASNKTKIVSKANEKNPEGLEELIFTMLKPYEVADEHAIIPPKLTRRAREKQEVLGLQLVFGPAIEMAHALGLPEAKDAAPTPAT